MADFLIVVIYFLFCNLTGNAYKAVHNESYNAKDYNAHHNHIHAENLPRIDYKITQSRFGNQKFPCNNPPKAKTEIHL